MARESDGGGAAVPRRADARLNRERVIAAAREVFAAQGPDASLNEIARRAGVGPGTLYRHFPNRQALVVAVVQERVDVLCAHADRLTTTADPARPAGPPDTPRAPDTSGKRRAPADAPDSSEAADAALAEWLGALLAHARLHQGMGVAAMLEDADDFGRDCHQRIRGAAESVLTRAQRAGTARTDIAVTDLVQLVAGIALTDALTRDEHQPARLLDLVLDAVHAPVRRAEI